MAEPFHDEARIRLAAPRGAASSTFGDNSCVTGEI
jgi:hypothetical protein